MTSTLQLSNQACWKIPQLYLTMIVQARNLHLSGISHEDLHENLGLFPWVSLWCSHLSHGDFPQSPRQKKRPDLLNALTCYALGHGRGRWRSSWTSSSQSFGFPTFPTTQGPAFSAEWATSHHHGFIGAIVSTIPPKMGAVHDCFTHMKGNTPMYIH